MYIKIKSKDLREMEDRLNDATYTLNRIKGVIEAESELDEHGNSAYKADKSLTEIRRLLEDGGYIKASSKVWLMPRIENMDDGIKVPRFVESRT